MGGYYDLQEVGGGRGNALEYLIHALQTAYIDTPRQNEPSKAFRHRVHNCHGRERATRNAINTDPPDDGLGKSMGKPTCHVGIGQQTVTGISGSSHMYRQFRFKP